MTATTWEAFTKAQPDRDHETVPQQAAMQFLLLILAIFASSTYAGSSSISSVQSSSTLSSLVKSTSARPDNGKQLADEHIQDSRKPCRCPPANCLPFLNAKAVRITSVIWYGLLILGQKCECHATANLACHKLTNGGCPYPAPVVCPSLLGLSIC